MPCPTTEELKGSGVVNVGYYTTRSEAETQARDLVPYRADIEGRLAFNGYHCPEKLCQNKHLGPSAFNITSVSSSLSLVASFFWWEWRYEGRAEFTWSVTVICTGPSPDALHLIGLFTPAARQRAVAVGTCVHGWLQNITCYFGIGEGCSAWLDWIWGWFIQSGWFEKVKIRFCYYWIGCFKHQVVVIMFPDGSEYVLDPWRDSSSPVWDREQYEREYHKLTCTGWMN